MTYPRINIKAISVNLGPDNLWCLPCPKIRLVKYSWRSSQWFYTWCSQQTDRQSSASVA